MAEFKPIETQEALDAIIRERIERERKKFADYDDLKAYRDAHAGKDITSLESQIEQLTKQVDALTKERDAKAAAASEATTKLTRIEVAQEAGLRPELADRIRGDSREDMAKDAQALAALQGSAKPRQPGYHAGKDNPAGGGKDAAFATMASDLMGSD